MTARAANQSTNFEKYLRKETMPPSSLTQADAEALERKIQDPNVMEIHDPHSKALNPFVYPLLSLSPISTQSL